MFLCHKKLFAFFAILQWMAFQISAESTSHTAFTFGWTSKDILEGLRDELYLVQKQAKDKSEFFEYLNIRIIPEYGYAYILYNLSDRMGETNSQITQIDYALGCNENMDIFEEKFYYLQNLAANENRAIDFIDFFPVYDWNCIYIIYEISEK